MKVADLLEQVRSTLNTRDIKAAIGKRKLVPGTNTVGKSLLSKFSVQSQCFELCFFMVKPNSKHGDLLPHYNECQGGDSFGSPYSVNITIFSWEWRKKYKSARKKEERKKKKKKKPYVCSISSIDLSHKILEDS